MQKITATYVKGIEQFPSSEGTGAREIDNLCWDVGERCWTNREGWISYFEDPSTFTSSVSSIFNWSPRGRIDRTIIEWEDEGGTSSIGYLAPYEPGGVLTLETGRHTPTTSEIGTTFAPYGDFLIYTNGYDGIRKWYGFAPQTTTPFGFTSRPSPPNIVDTEDGGFVGVKLGPSNYRWQAFFGASEGITKITVCENTTFGLGNPAADSVNAYSYRVSFITDTGSESPLSIPSQVVRWVNGNTTAYDDNDPLSATYPARYCIQLTNIPTGPIGTVKRRLYRTKNLENLTGTADEQSYYFLDDIPNNMETSYTDVIADANLGSLGPTELESTIIPQNLKFVTTFGNRIVAGGGNSYPTRIFFSQAYRPEQFAVQNFIELGVRDGGRITGFLPYNNLLLVFRERAIDALIPSGDTAAPFYSTPVYQTMGSIATKTAQVVAGAGVYFVASDGVYLLSGNFSGGSQVQMQKISDGIQDIWDTVSIYSLAKACAVWDPNWNAYTVSLPVDGKSYNSIVLRFTPGTGSWARFTDIPAACMTISREDALIFGTNQASIGWLAPTGVGVLCDSSFAGYELVEEEYSPRQKTPASWTSSWLDFGDPDRTKAIKSVSIDCYSTHGLSVLDAGKDWEWEFPYQTFSEMVQPDGNPITQWQIGIVGTSTWENKKVAKVRYDIELPDVRFFRFRIKTTEGEPAQVKLIGYSVYYDLAGEEMAWSQSFDYLGGANGKVNPSKIPL